MLSLLVAAVFAIPVAIFATENSELVTVSFLGNKLSGVPVYLIVLLTLSIGIVFASVLSITYRLSAAMQLRGKLSQLEKEEKKNLDMAKTVHELEIELAELKTKYEPESVDEKSL